MRKWQNLAAPDDAGSWRSVSNMWPTKRFTYETADTSTATELNTTTGTVVYAFAARTVSGTVREYVIGASIYEYSAGALTDRTGGVTVGAVGKPMMAQYGDITICVMGSAIATVKSSGGNFSALAGAPKGEIVLVQSNAVLIFNTDTSADGWAASDVGDYTNWTTGEAASGRIITTPGPITAAISFGNDVMVFKRDAIYRMTYVGGLVKWQIQLVWKGLGSAANGLVAGAEKYQAIACASGVAFRGDTSADSTFGIGIYLFDGASRPRRLNPLTTVVGEYFTSLSTFTFTHTPAFWYDPVEDVLCVADGFGSSYYYYSFPMDAWGKGGGATGEALDSFGASNSPLGIVQGDYYAQPGSSRPAYYRYGSTNSKVRRCVPNAPTTGTCNLTTALLGRVDRKTLWSRLTPLMRRRSGGAAALAVSAYREREHLDSSTTSSTQAPTESTIRKRFDFQLADNFATFGVTWTDLDVEVDDFLIVSKDAGEN